MKKFAEVALLATLMLSGSVVASQALTIPFNGNLGDLNASQGGVFVGADFTFDSINDVFQFSLSKKSKISFTFGHAYSDSSQLISAFMLSLYNGSTGTGTALRSNDAVNVPSTIIPGAGDQRGALADILSANNYSFVVSGTPNFLPAYYTGNISLVVQAVPLPATLPMFGAALLAVAGAGVVAKRRAVKARQAAART